MKEKASNEFGDWIVAMIMWCSIIIVIIYAILGWRNEKKIKKEFGAETSEILITDKYNCLGSSFHLIGGRTTETEYHLVYQYRCINRPNSEYKSNWQQRDKEVTYTTWANYNVGDKITIDGSSDFLY